MRHPACSRQVYRCPQRGPWGSRFGQQQAPGFDYLEEFVIRPIQAIHLCWEEQRVRIGGWMEGWGVSNGQTDRLAPPGNSGIEGFGGLSKWRVRIIILNFRYIVAFVKFIFSRILN